MEKLSPDELRSLRAYADASPPIAIRNDERMFRKLMRHKLVIGAVKYDARGDPFGVIQLTERGRAALGEGIAA